MRCDGCGALLAAGATWCGQCFRTPGATTTAAPGSPARALPPSSPAFRPTYTRWGPTATTFGPLGRVLCTLAVLAVCAVALFSQNPLAIGPLCFVAAPLVLRSVWAKGRVV